MITASLQPKIHKLEPPKREGIENKVRTDSKHETPIVFLGSQDTEYYLQRKLTLDWASIVYVGLHYRSTINEISDHVTYFAVYFSL